MLRGSSAHHAQESAPAPAPDSSSIVALRPYPRLRALILGAVLVYFVATALINLLYGHSGSFLSYLSLLLLACVMFGPLALFPKLGPLHVLVAPALIWFAQLVLRQSELVAFGLSRHDALPGLTAVELNTLCAKMNGLSALAQGAFLLGYALVRRVSVPALQFGPPKLLTTKTLVLVAATAVALVAYHAAAGGLEGMLLIRGISRDAREEIRGGDHLVVILGLPTVLAYVLYNIWKRAPKSLLFWGTLAFALVSVFLASGSRSALLYPLIVLLLLHFALTGNLPKVSLLVFAMSAWLLVGAIGLFRSAHFGARSVDWGIFSEYTVSDILEAGSEDLSARGTERNGNLPPLHFVPEDSPLLLGSTYLRILLTPVPQALLPFEKPTAAGRLNGQLFFGVDAGIPVDSVIEAYWNFHVPGILVIFFALGITAAYVFRLYLLNHAVPGAATLYILYLIYFDFSSQLLVAFLQRAAIAVLITILFCGMPRIVHWRSVNILHSETGRGRLPNRGPLRLRGQ